MLKEPAYPQAEFDRVVQPRIKALENAQTEPTQLAAETLTRHSEPVGEGRCALYAARAKSSWRS